jgi:hypothetical protein
MQATHESRLLAPEQHCNYKETNTQYHLLPTPGELRVRAVGCSASAEEVRALLGSGLVRRDAPGWHVFAAEAAATCPSECPIRCYVEKIDGSLRQLQVLRRRHSFRFEMTRR